MKLIKIGGLFLCSAVINTPSFHGKSTCIQNRRLYLKMLVQKYRKKRLTLETALFVQMTTSSVSKRVSHDCSMTCHFSVHQPNIHIFKVTCCVFISFGLLAGSSWMYS